MSHPTRTIKWNAYRGSNIILNIDGSSLGNPCASGFSGLTQNADGAWIHNFVGNIDYSNIMYVELMELYHGLRVIWELVIKYMMCYSDSNSTINFIFESINI